MKQPLDLDELCRPRMDRGSALLIKQLLEIGYGEAVVRIRDGKIDQIVTLKRNMNRKDLLKKKPK